MSAITKIFILLILYQVKYFVCDVLLQKDYMQGKYKDWPKFIGPLFTHSMVHYWGTLLIVVWFDPRHALIYALGDALTHFIIERVNTSPKMFGRFKALTQKEYEYIMEGKGIPQYHRNLGWSLNLLPLKYVQRNRILLHDKLFKISFGAEQMFHFCTQYFIIYWLVK